MIEKTYVGERAKVEMEKAELEELMAREREKAYWQGQEAGNERIKKAVHAFAILLNLLLDEKK